jgi:two-component system, NarL family, sensor kinase
MVNENRYQELVTLKEIAETLNKSNDIHLMLNEVLKKLMKLTGLKSGWIFLVDGNDEYTLAADVQLPPGLNWKDKTPMCSGSCWCLNRYWDGRLKYAVNIMECKRLEDAVKYDWGDTNGITHHATVPLIAGEEMFGLLNVASPAKEHFDEEELALLQSVSFQIGMAIKRVRLYEAQQKRADYYVKLGNVSRELAKVHEIESLGDVVVEQICNVFHWQTAAFYLKEGDGLRLRSLFKHGQHEISESLNEIGIEHEVGKAFIKKKPVFIPDNHNDFLELPHYKCAIAVPLLLQNESVGVLWVGSKQYNAYDDRDVEILRALSSHISLSIENSRLYKDRRELTLLEERNRLARDLHDSVCQMLFSLKMTTGAAEQMTLKNSNLLKDMLREIQSLSNDALKEMRSLIWQLRPAGLEEGLVTALKTYANSLSLQVEDQVNGVVKIPRHIEEMLWRIGQEAFNNIAKHAGTKKAYLHIIVREQEVKMKIVDKGSGFDRTQTKTKRGKSIGLLSMQERTSLHNGTITIDSAIGKGTSISVWIPFANIDKI